MYVVLSLSCSCLLMFCIMSCFVWTPGRVAAAIATTNGDPIKYINTDTKCDVATVQTRYNAMVVCLTYSLRASYSAGKPVLDVPTIRMPRMYTQVINELAKATSGLSDVILV